MIFLRSEEHLDSWLTSNGWEAGATLDAAKLNELSREWWGTRLAAGWQPRPAAESQAILDRLDLVGEFWSYG